MKEVSKNGRIHVRSPSSIDISLYQRGTKGYWAYYYTVGGKVFRGSAKTDHFDTAKMAAIGAAEDAAARRKLGMPIEKKNGVPLVKDFWLTYLNDHAKPNKRELTVDRDLVSSLHILSFFGEMMLVEISKSDVAKYQKIRLSMKHQGKGTPIKARSINIEVKLLSAMLNKAVDWETIKFNPIAKVNLLPEDPPRSMYFRADTWRSLGEIMLEQESRNPPYSVSGRLRYYAVVEVGTAMRPDEMHELKISSDLDFQSKQIHIRDSKTHSVRAVPMSDPVYEALKREIVIVKKKWPACDYVFPNSRGQKSSTYVFYRPFHKILKKLGLKGYRRYDMRHTGASWLVQNGCNLFVLQDLMGHKSLTTTRRYAHLERKQRQEAVDSISDKLYIGGKGGEDSKAA